ncbi:glucose-1-phosphate adenylyltransferase [Ranunculus cassubicifolius]
MVMAGTSESSTLHFLFQGDKAVSDTKKSQTCLDPNAGRSPENPNWLQETADAVGQYLWLFEEHNVMELLVLAGDHLYRMDYERFIQTHSETNADITLAALPMDEKHATAFGLMKIDEE